MSTVVRRNHPDATRECTRCRRAAVMGHRWRTATPDQRTAWRAAGLVRHEGRGLCQSCYRWAQQTGRLEDYERTNARWADIVEEWRHMADPMRTHVENARHLAPRLGVSEGALKLAVVKAGIRSRFDNNGRLRDAS